MNIGKTIETLRKEQGLTQYELAEQCNLSQTYLSLIEKNKRDVRVSTLQNISKELGVPLPFMLFLSLSEEDIISEKRESFKILEPIVKNLIEQLI